MRSFGVVCVHCVHCVQPGADDDADTSAPSLTPSKLAAARRLSQQQQAQVQTSPGAAAAAAATGGTSSGVSVRGAHGDETEL